jgi:tight adherence protein C
MFRTYVEGKYGMNFFEDERLWLGLFFTAGLLFVLALRFYRAELKDAKAKHEGEHFKSEKQLALPAFSRVLAAPIAWVAVRISSFISAASTLKISTRLTAAGLDASLSAEGFIAMKLLVSLGCFLMFVTLFLVRSEPIGAQGLCLIFLCCAASFWLPDSWLRDVGIARRNRILKVLPFYIDLLKIAIEAGSNMQGALQYAVSFGPAGPLRNEFSKVLSDIRSGRSRAQALQDLSRRCAIAPIAHLSAAITTAEKQGASLGPILTAQAEQRRQERFIAAETAAMKAPVKMLGPLVLFIFPGTFIILFFPVVVRLFQEGLIR